jgi:hypothetical protein
MLPALAGLHGASEVAPIPVLRLPRPPAVCETYTESVWGQESDGTAHLDGPPSSIQEWRFASDGRVSTFECASSALPVYRIASFVTQQIFARERTLMVSDGEQTPHPELVAEVLLGCEGLGSVNIAFTLQRELELAVNVERKTEREYETLTYSLPNDAPGWRYQLRWKSVPAARFDCYTIHVPVGANAAGVEGRRVEVRVVEYSGGDADAYPTVVERRVFHDRAEGTTIVGMTRYEVVERRAFDASKDQHFTAWPGPSEGWQLSYPDRGFGFEVGRREFRLLGAMYFASEPLDVHSASNLPAILQGAHALHHAHSAEPRRAPKSK